MLKKLLLALTLVVLSFVAVAVPSYAATTDAVSVRVQQPKTPTNQNNFTLTFVALSTVSNPITVTCYKKGPTDADFAQFGSPITLSNGGNTDNCTVDTSVLTSNGSYDFYVSATDGTASATSETVSVNYNGTDGPGAPGQYSKDQVNSCTYLIKFQTANDSGKTIKVELYRSENTSFSADSGTKVDTQSITSNTNGSFTNAVPDCTKTYYFALRAFDMFGNGSGVVGDISTTTNTVYISGTPVPQQGAIPVSGSNNGSGQGVLGAKTGPTPTGSVTGTQNAGQKLGENKKEVKGMTKSVLSSPAAWVYLALAAAMIIVLVVLQRYFAKVGKEKKTTKK